MNTPVKSHTPQNETITSATESLLSSFDQLRLSIEQLKGRLQQDPAELPFWLPPEHEQENANAILSSRDRVIRALTSLWRYEQEDFPLSGICCASPQAIECALAVNAAKQQFKASVTHFKTVAGIQKDKITRVLDQIISTEGAREAELASSLNISGLSRLHLIWCYRQILILPPKLQSISWTWMKKHREITRLSVDDAMKLALKLEDPITRESTLQQLQHEDSSQPLAYIKPIAQQLRANIVWEEDQEKQRKLIITPTVVLCQDASLPRLKWPDPPEQAQSRLERSDRKIEPHPIIPALNLYRYLERVNPQCS
ncbi:DNA replication terminus site-binding protein [Marinibactrum halimedae]|uniref:DNA replication terminus site-binding protein n=1 Tax=Marinibactrum halimedae TaxID=1444977 RepID=A0AA37WNK8_9GAMM|nr:DNA replication terminus site-binding protein [Marinibactrum halimedae]MCD9459490.1 DNA replication terminus site-binding protein [Marinibactrum halimedae]GLS28144.1 hypothetical protein GCM10007877_38630 [Marinibactrum halimedae]